MDQSINEWLDEHPQYEVKFVNGSIGTMRGKTGPQDVADLSGLGHRQEHHCSGGAD